MSMYPRRYCQWPNLFLINLNKHTFSMFPVGDLFFDFFCGDHNLILPSHWKNKIVDTRGWNEFCLQGGWQLLFEIFQRRTIIQTLLQQSCLDLTRNAEGYEDYDSRVRGTASDVSCHHSASQLFLCSCNWQTYPRVHRLLCGRHVDGIEKIKAIIKVIPQHLKVAAITLDLVCF